MGGFVRTDRVRLLTATGTPFVRDGDAFALPGEDFASRSRALASVVDRLAASGKVSLRGELYPVVAAHGDAPLLQIDRGAVPFFGVRPFGVHLCAFVRRGRESFAWVAVRARDKTFPGLWDNTVAGGQPIDLSLRDNLVKECREEASMSPELAARANATATITYVREDESGLKPDTLFCYDLEVPADFTPRPHDGEVESFQLLPLRDIAAAVRDTERCKPNCALVWIDFLLRHGALDSELGATERAALANSLHVPLPQPLAHP